jgi:hypothetical protein
MIEHHSEERRKYEIRLAEDEERLIALEKEIAENDEINVDNQPAKDEERKRKAGDEQPYSDERSKKSKKE